MRGLALGLVTAINESPAAMLDEVDEVHGEVRDTGPVETVTADAAAAGEVDADRGVGGPVDDDDLGPTHRMPLGVRD